MSLNSAIPARCPIPPPCEDGRQGIWGSFSVLFLQRLKLSGEAAFRSLPCSSQPVVALPGSGGAVQHPQHMTAGRIRKQVVGSGLQLLQRQVLLQKAES